MLFPFLQNIFQTDEYVMANNLHSYKYINNNNNYLYVNKKHPENILHQSG